MKHTHKLMVKFEGAKGYERYGVFFSEDDAWGCWSGNVRRAQQH